MSAIQNQRNGLSVWFVLFVLFGIDYCIAPAPDGFIPSERTFRDLNHTSEAIQRPLWVYPMGCESLVESRLAGKTDSPTGTRPVGSVFGSSGRF